MSEVVALEAEGGRKKKIAFICLNYPPAIGGIASQLSGLAGEFAKRGLEVHILTPGFQGAPAFEENGNVLVHRISTGNTRFISKVDFIFRALICLYKIKPELVHSHDIFLPTTITAIYNFLTNTAVILTIHTSSSGLGLGDVALIRKSRLGLFRQNWLSRHFDYFVVISQFIERELRTIGIPESKLVPIPNGIDMSRFVPSSREERAALRKQLDLPQGFLVIYTGRINSDKRVQYLIAIWGNVRNVYPDATLLLVGSGPDEKSFRQLAGPGVIFTGSVKDVALYLRAADLFVLPSISEGFSLSTLEALACGLPVIATPVGAILELIHHGQNGWIVEIDDLAMLERAILVLMGDPDLCIQLGRAARQSVEKRYSISMVASQLIDLYSTAVNGR